MEEEMSSRMEVIEKLRIQVKDLEKEKRDTLRRYNEQVKTVALHRVPRLICFAFPDSNL